MTAWISGLALFRSLHHRPFALLWSGQALSRIGDYLYQIVLAWWVLQETGSATMMATVFIVAYTPTILFGLIGGVAVDRYPRLQIMITTDLFRCVVLGIVALLVWQETFQLWHVFVMSLLLELADAFFQPAYAVVIPQLVPEEALPSANSLTSLSVQIGRIIGPPLGALLLAIGGTATAFALNGFTFFLSALLLLPLLRRERQRSAIAPIPPSHSPLLDFREGIATVLRMPWLWMSILIYAMANVTLGGPYSVALPFLVEEQLSANVQTLGLLYALFAAGYALGGIWLGRKMQLPRRGILIYGGLAIGGLMLLVVGLPIGLPLIAVAALLNGVAMEVSGLAWTNALQTLVPHEKLGRVTSIDAIGSMALMPIGFGLTGWAIELWGSPTTIVLGGGVTAVVALLMLWHPAIHRLD